MKKNAQIELLKGLGIIYVVIGHSGSPINKYIYLFHMPFFIFISGYLYKEYYSQTPFLLIFKRIKSLYIPFLKYSFLFILLHNVFYYYNFYINKYTLDLNTTKNILKSLLTFTYTEQFLAGFWFLQNLFFINIVFVFISFIAMKTSKKFSIEAEFIRLSLIVILFSIGNKLLVKYGIEVPYQQYHKVLMTLPMFYLGFLFCKFEKYIQYNIYFLIVCLGVLFNNSFYGNLEISSNIYINPGFYISSALCGIYINLYITKLIYNKENKIIYFLRYVGNKTLPILAYHFLCFKIVSYIYIRFNNLPLKSILIFPVVKETRAWWIIYVFSGIFLPLSIDFLYSRFTNLISIGKLVDSKNQ
jgi:fucose 4-O-acetylase-like acetyltransferase